MQARRITGVFLILGFAVGIGTAFARAPLTVNPIPGSLQELFGTLKPGGGNSIPDYLAGAQCGGWSSDPNRSIVGLIALVTGLPGSQYTLGDIQFGMSRAVEGSFSFPGDTTGKTTVCDAGRGPKVSRSVWSDQAHARIPKLIDYPQFQDPPCRWKGAPGSPNATLRNEPHSEQTCTEFCDWVNTITYEDCPDRNIIEVEVPGSDPPRTVKVCKPNGWLMYYSCSGKEIAGSDPVTNAPNCRQLCTGEECRCSGPGCISIDTPEGRKGYRSFYRRYAGGYARATLLDVPRDVGNKTVRAACYGFYHEFLIDGERTGPEDWRCSIDTDNVGQLLTSQTGKGLYTATSDADPYPPEDKRWVPPPDFAVNLWVPLSGAFSLLNERVFHTVYEKQLSKAYLNSEAIDHARELSTRQLPMRDQAISNTTREFDDTGISTVVHWWHKQQQAMTRILHQLQLHLLLPARGALGGSVSAVPSAKEIKDGDPQSQPIRLQLDAGEDLIGTVLRELSAPLEEVPIPVPLFLVSSTEVHAVREAWCLRIMQETGRSTCNPNDDPADLIRDEVWAILEKLDLYATWMDSLPALRSSLARHLGDVLQVQQTIAKPVIAALRPILETYRTLLREQIRLEQTLRPGWEEAERTYRTFHDETNLPMCMNQRFTATVKSLLDRWGWLPARGYLGSVTEQSPAGNLPTLEGLVETSRDIVIDLTHIPVIDQSLKIPVFKPVPVRIDLPKPPEDLKTVTYELPDLPNIALIDQAMAGIAASLPEIDTSHVTPPTVQLSPLDPGIVAQAQEIIARINDTMRKMNASYKYFWDSVFAFTNRPGSTPPTCEGRPLQPLQCCGWDQLPCLPEMDLVAMMMRVASRPMVNLKEDYESKSPPRTDPTVCLPEDPACTLLPPEFLPATTYWETIGPQPQTGMFDQMRSTVNQETLPPGIGHANPPPLDIDIEEILPSIDVPHSIPLIPTTP